MLQRTLLFLINYISLCHIFLPTTSFLDFCLFHLFDSQERGRRERKEPGRRTNWQEGRERRGEQELSSDGRPEGLAGCLPQREVSGPVLLASWVWRSERVQPEEEGASPSLDLE